MVPVADLWPRERSAVATAQILVSGLVGDPLQPRAGRLTFSATATHVLAFQNVLCWIGNMGTKNEGRLIEPALVGTGLPYSRLVRCTAVLFCRFRPAEALIIVVVRGKT